MPLIPYNSENSRQLYNDHYNQSGHVMNVFHGQQIQKGYGLGGIFTSLAKSALPLLKKGAMALGKTALQTGVKLAQDRLAGKDMRHTTRDHLASFGSSLISNYKKSGIKKKTNRANKRKSPASKTSSASRRAKLARKQKKTFTKTYILVNENYG